MRQIESMDLLLELTVLLKWTWGQYIVFFILTFSFFLNFALRCLYYVYDSNTINVVISIVTER